MIKTLINNWCALRIPMIGSAIIVMMISLLIFFASQYKNNQHLSLSNANALYNNARQKLHLSKLEQQNIVQYLPRYQQLLQVGFIGEERRQQWVEQLRQVRTQYHLFNIDFEIAQQQTYQYRLIAQEVSHEMHRSAMILKLDLLHEGDLVHLLTGLRENTSPFMVRDCEVLRMVDAEINTGAMEGNLKARCEIDWFTLKARS